MKHQPYSKIITFIFALIVTPTSAASLPYTSPIRKVEGYVQKAIQKNFHSGTTRALMKKHYEHLRLLSKDGQWAVPQLESISDQLLPEKLSQEQLSQFVERVREHAEENPYLVNALIEAENPEYQSGVERLKQQADEKLLDVITYAMTLENLTKSIADDPSLLTTLNDVFEPHSGDISTANFWHQLKHYSVKASVDKFRTIHANGKAPADFGSFLLPLNILEASLLEWFYGKKGNAKAGYTLMTNATGPKRYDPKTGAGPAKLSDDKKAVEIHMPFEEIWADLYGSWNMGFISNLRAYLYHMPKLMIPAVNGYHNNPSTYVYYRAITLYLHSFYILFRNLEDPEFQMEDFSNDEISNAFSVANKLNAKDYKALFKRFDV